MASGFPILFGAPSFGDEDRDQWIRVLTLFLADPFAISGVNIGGNLVTNSGWQVPSSAITGLDLTFTNNFGVRELNPFSSPTSVSNGSTSTISDRPGLLVLFQGIGLPAAVFGLTDSFTHCWLYTDLGAYSTAQGVSGKTNVYYDAGEEKWKIENLTGADVDYYLLIASMGAQRT